ncbi:cd7 antigen-like isoform X2 [Thalassophryne amazonica]|uniref:cd7 antigen-like isoform X2 n=1 Tax=Thalassophryne amazonica TaxID=390379 RepID=UPI001471A671|nr:cd7 antigen-like isoform X2 [Thalassophryne amazonica]
MLQIQNLVCLWTLFFTLCSQTWCHIEFLEKREGESVVLPCLAEQSNSSPIAVTLKRSWRRHTNVLFMYSNSKFSVHNQEDEGRISVSGDPSSRSLNVTISQLRAGDTDRYYCEFVEEVPSSLDIKKRGKMEFFLLVVVGDAPDSVDIKGVEVCAGDSALLLCLPPHGAGTAVEGVSLKRQRGQAPMEVLYDSKQHHSTPSPSSSLFPAERIRLSSAPGPTGITYSLTVQQLQPGDSGLYSCQLLHSGTPDTSSSLGKQVYFVSVQGGPCSCSRYSFLLYVLSAAVAILFVLLVVLVLICRAKGRHTGKAHVQAPIYEEMSGVQPLRSKLVSHLEETDGSVYRNCSVKKPCLENHYETPISSTGNNQK